MDKSWRPIDWKLPTGLTASEHTLFELGASAIIPHVEEEVKRQARWAMSEDNCWMWLGDGEDHLESLVCDVLIRADQLRSLIAEVRAQTLREVGQLIEKKLSEYSTIQRGEHGAEDVMIPLSVVRSILAPLLRGEIPQESE